MVDLGSAIKDTLYKYIAVRSYTATVSENEVTEFLTRMFGSIPYFAEGPGKFGVEPIEGDPYGRGVFWAFVRGEGEKTAIMIHHSDVVSTEDFGSLAHLAFAPDELKAALHEIKGELGGEARRDLDDDTFIFGKGGCDMKAGGAIQIEIMKYFAGGAPIKGNLLLLAVPDEENLSAGMRTAIPFLKRLKEDYGLSYEVMINSEPHQRKDPARGLFSTGSVGKAMPFFYVRGKLAHIGKVFEGVDPILIMSELVRRTELQESLSDAVAGEVSPPPVWLGFRDRKEGYDVSIPLTAVGCMSMLTLGRPLKQIESDIREICEAAAVSVVETIEERYRKHREQIDPASGAGTEVEGQGLKSTLVPAPRVAARGRLDSGSMPSTTLNNKILVSSISELITEATEKGGEAFIQAYKNKLAEINASLVIPINSVTPSSSVIPAKAGISSPLSLADATYALIDYIYENITDQSPRIIYGLLPPYYPATSDLFAPGCHPREGGDLVLHLQKYTKNILDHPYDTEHFYTGISDLSYGGYSKEDATESEAILKNIMPLYGNYYSIPFEELSEIAMPVINIGPWGKDFHKLTERVLEKDTLTETPSIIFEALRYLEII